MKKDSKIQEKTYLTGKTNTPAIFNSKEYYDDLRKVQPANSFVDIFTITGFMSVEQKIQHILSYALQSNRLDLVQKWS